MMAIWIIWAIYVLSCAVSYAGYRMFDKDGQGDEGGFGCVFLLPVLNTMLAWHYLKRMFKD